MDRMKDNTTKVCMIYLHTFLGLNTSPVLELVEYFIDGLAVDYLQVISKLTKHSLNVDIQRAHPMVSLARNKIQYLGKYPTCRFIQMKSYFNHYEHTQ